MKNRLLVLTDDEYAVLVGAVATWFQAVQSSVPVGKRSLVESVLKKLGFEEEPASKIQIVRG